MRNSAPESIKASTAAVISAGFLSCSQRCAHRIKGGSVRLGAGLVPGCAMQVTRAYEAGDLSPYHPNAPCGCYFESKVGGSSPECADGGGLPVDAGPCFASPSTHAELINQCTAAVGVAKNPVLPLLSADGGLPPLP